MVTSSDTQLGLVKSSLSSVWLKAHSGLLSKRHLARLGKRVLDYA